MSNLVNYKLLYYGISNISHHNNKGHVLGHRGGSNKRNFFLVDYIQSFWNMTGLVISIKKDYRKSALLAFVSFPNGIISYILAPLGISPGFFIRNDTLLNILTLGARVYLWQLHLGAKLYNLSDRYSNGRGLYSRAAGTFGLILRKNKEFILIKLPSGETKLFPHNVLANIGRVNNLFYSLINTRKAGNARASGRRPVVRGVAKNPVDHPHGGGEGKTSGGRPSVSPWGKITKGFLTKSRNKVISTASFILRYRTGFRNAKNILFKKQKAKFKSTRIIS